MWPATLGKICWRHGLPKLVELPRQQLGALNQAVAAKAASRYITSCAIHRSQQQSIGKPQQGISPRPGADEHLNHTAIAKVQQLYTTNAVSPGSPFFLPHGTRIFNKLLAFMRAQYTLYGYQEVVTPLIYKRRLWEQSGHWENFHDDMFEVKGRGARGEDVFQGGVYEVGQEEPFGLKPMNCPGHCLVFASKNRSYRDLPLRLADFSSLHRNERSSQLSGLTRVRRFHQDDAHIFCRPSQIASEISAQLQFLDNVYNVFKLHDYSLELSTRPENYIGDLSVWERAEAALKTSLDASGRPWTLNEGDGAFYGPKIDIMMKDSLGRKHQTATIQLDFQLPIRFELGYHVRDPELEVQGLASPNNPEATEDGNEDSYEEKGEQEQDGQQGSEGKVRRHWEFETSLVPPVIIHRAILGSLERFMALLAEHYQGRWPFWLSPRQAVIVTVKSSEEVLALAEETHARLSGSTNPHGAGVARPMSHRSYHVDRNMSTRTSLGQKIMQARNQGYNYVIVVGDKNVQTGTVSVTPLFPSAAATAASRASSGGGGPAKAMELTIDEVYQMFGDLEDRYE